MRKGVVEEGLELVCLHGFTGAPESFDAVLPEPGVGWKGAWMPWLLGHGADPELGPTSFAAEVERLESIRIDRGPRPSWLVGYSMGARVALAWLVLQAERGAPEPFRGAVLIGVHPGLADSESRERRRNEDREWISRLQEEGLEGFVSSWEARSLFMTQRQVDAGALARQREIRLGHRAEGLARALEVLGLGAMPPLGERLGGIRCPVWLVVGAKDQKFTNLAEDMVPRLAQGRVVKIVECGHNPVLEQPSVVLGLLSAAPEEDRWVD